MSCTGKKNADKNQTGQISYELVKDWPGLRKGFILSQPTGIGIDNADHILVFHRAGRKWTSPFPDSVISRHTVLELHNETGKILNSWGGGYFIMPHGLTVDKKNNVWLTDVGLHQIFKFSHEGKLLMQLGIAKVPGNDSLHFDQPTDIAVADDGSFYVSDGYGNSRIVKFLPNGRYVKEWGVYGRKPGEFIIPHGIAIDNNNRIYVADRQNNRVQLFDTAGKFLKELKNDMQVEQLPSVVIDHSNQIFAVDFDPTKQTDSSVNGSTIFVFDSAGGKTRFGRTGSAMRTSSWFHDLAFDSKGNIYVGDILNLKVLKFRPVKRDEK